MTSDPIPLSGFAKASALWLAPLALLVLAAGWLDVKAQGLGVGPPLRQDFAGRRSKPAPPTAAVPTGTTGPPLRQDFTGNRAMPPRPSTVTTPTGPVGPPLRLDFSGSRTKPQAPAH